ncbi:MAG TPA: LamB/YcsF family protein, partial [Paralcaligenes sp.]
GLQVAEEVFADRSYQSDGTLTSRLQPNAMIVDINVSIRQVLRMIREGKIRTVQGSDIDVRPDTLCIHGDQPGAPAFAKAIRQALEAEGIAVRAVGA